MPWGDHVLERTRTGVPARRASFAVCREAVVGTEDSALLRRLLVPPAALGKALKHLAFVFWDVGLKTCGDGGHLKFQGFGCDIDNQDI